MTTAPIGCLDGEQAIRDALAAFPDGWESAFIEARETEWGGVVHIGHPWEDEGLAEVITVDTENYSDSPSAMKIAAFIVAANPKSIAGIVAELDRLRSASRQEGSALAMRVLQSDLYHQLDDREKAECDALLPRREPQEAQGDRHGE